MTIAPEAPSPAPLGFLSLEITSRCQLTCPTHCYAQAGSTAGHGTMTTEDWLRIIDEAAAFGTTTLQLIGSEPALHPDFAQLVRHAVEAGLLVRVYSNFVRVRREHWQIFQHPSVHVATTVCSDDPTEHDTITGRPGSHAATVGNIAEALHRGLRPTVAVIDLGRGQRVGQARAAMTALGVPGIRVDRVRAVGNAANDTPEFQGSERSATTASRSRSRCRANDWRAVRLPQVSQCVRAGDAPGHSVRGGGVVLPFGAGPR